MSAVSAIAAASVQPDEAAPRTLADRLAPPAGDLKLEPAHDITFPEAHDIGSVFFRPGERSLIVQLRAEVVDLWPLAVHYWPEVLGGLVLILLVPLLVILLRIRRRPRRRGAPHCRRCNYDLSAHVAAAGAEPDAEVRCPECGVNLAARRPLIGRTRRRRAAPFLAAVVLLLVGYGGMLALGVPRDGVISHVFNVPSLGLHRYGEAKGWAWLKPYRVRRDLLVEIDLESGDRLRQWPIRREATWIPTQISPDGRFMALSGPAGRIDCVSVDSGRTIATFDEAVQAHPAGRFLHVVGFAPDSQSLYLAYAEKSEKKERLVRWRFGQDEVETCIEAPLYVEDYDTPGRADSVVRRYRVVPGGGPVRYLAAPEFTEAYHDKRYYLALYDGDGALVGEHTLPGDASPSAAPCITPDGKRVYVSASHRGIVGFDLEEQSLIGVLTTMIQRFFPYEEMIASPDSRLLYVSCFPDVVMVRDTVAQEWVAALDYPGNYVAPELTLSPEGRWLAAVPFESKGGAGARGPYLHHLLLYDLAALQRD